MMWRGAALLTMLIATPAWAQTAAPAESAETMLANERAQFLPPPPARTVPCDQSGDEIVVCARRTDTSRYRIPSTIDEAPTSDRGTQNGMPHTAQSLVSDLPECTPGKACPHFGHVPPPIYYIDLSKIPEPPPGSDADKIAKGEMPAP
jgi:hypothetical protein